MHPAPQAAQVRWCAARITLADVVRHVEGAHIMAICAKKLHHVCSVVKPSDDIRPAEIGTQESEEKEHMNHRQTVIAVARRLPHLDRVMKRRQ